MKQNKIKAIFMALLIAVGTILPFIPAIPAKADDSGTYFGVDYDITGNKLTLTGTSTMADTNTNTWDNSPWARNTSITEVECDFVPAGCLQSLFEGLVNVETITFGSNFVDNLSNVTNMFRMFYECKKITTLDLSGWDVSNVTHMGYMFYNCQALTTTGALNSWRVTSANILSSLFRGCYLLADIGDLSGWDVSNVTDMKDMFSCCYALTNIGDISGWQTGNVTDMSSMFSGCKFTMLDLSRWDVSNVKDMRSMFLHCDNLTSIGDTSSWQTGNVTDMSSMFEGCSSLTDIPGISGWNTGKVGINLTNKSWMEGMSNMFRDCSSLTLLDLSGWDVSNVKDMSHMFAGCENLTSIGDVSRWETGNVGVVIASRDNDSFWGMFDGCEKLASLDTGGWDVSNATNMKSMFNNCLVLTSIGDVSGWQTGNVTDMSYMFSNSSIYNIDFINSWDVNKVTTMDYMFSGLCLEDVSVEFLTGVTSLKKMSNMFRNTAFESFYMYLPQNSVTDMSSMFRDAFIKRNPEGEFCGTFDVSDMDVSTVKNADYMFYCADLPALDLSTWNLDALTSASLFIVGRPETFGPSFITHDITLPNRTNITIDRPYPSTATYEYSYHSVEEMNEDNYEEMIDSSDCDAVAIHDLLTSSRGSTGANSVNVTTDDFLANISTAHSRKRYVSPEHDLDEDSTITVLTPNCTTQGVKYTFCEDCEVWIKEYIPIDGDAHDFGPWEEINSETKKRTCRRCGYVQRETIVVVDDPEPPLPSPGTSHNEHIPGNPVIENEVMPTCTKDGGYDYVKYCKFIINSTPQVGVPVTGGAHSVCGKEISREHFVIKATGHDFKVTVKDATCQSEGRKTYTCKKCGYSYYESIPKLEHKTETTITRLSEPTCVMNGREIVEDTCTLCDLVLNKEYKSIPALGHEPGDPVIENEVEATYDHDGGYDKAFYCDVCHHEIKREHVGIPALVKEAEEPKEEPKEPEHVHNYKVVETVEATCDEKGYIKYECECGDSYYEYTDALGHEPGETVRENILNPTYDNIGGYDEVVYCIRGHEELSRKHIDMPKLTKDEPTPEPEEPVIKEHVNVVPIVAATATATVGGGGAAFFFLFWKRRRKIKGHVQSDNPVGIRVTLKGKDNLEDTTDVYGDFEFKNLKEDNYMFEMRDVDETLLLSANIYTRAKTPEEAFIVVEGSLSAETSIKGKTINIDIQ